ncbi:hypothetical protein J1N35_019184 [Gossypium stocksii]|uniref:Ammonium transporter AmtB-like domain-containing protein n=1 Tax=Gossypium stocksii TaxID=47602 RepID=A0A9D4A5N1_9ROSI|nr:hypothetical protein J1N35_019184 [Gossypium stocksii]
MGKTHLPPTITGCTVVLITFFRKEILIGNWNMINVCSGLLDGFIAIVFGYSMFELWVTIICDFVIALVLIRCNKLADKVKFDKPLKVAQLHDGCSAWGILFMGLFVSKKPVRGIYSSKLVQCKLFISDRGRLLATLIIHVTINYVIK